MKKILQFVYSTAAYLIAFASLLFWILSVSHLIPAISIDRPASLPFWMALLKNVGLVMLFGLQHSIMARPSFKKWLKKFLPVPIERSTFVLISGLLLAFLVVQWAPMGGSIWSVEKGTVLYLLLYVLFFFGWGMLFVSTFLINHFDLFGLRQTYFELINKPYVALEFRVKSLYKVVRHPLYLGGIIGLWATPIMSGTHFVFALLLSAYFVIGTLFEERDMKNVFGEQYEQYRKQVPMFLPYTKRKVKTLFSIKKA